ncbi:hypothetical protein [Microbacterium enclense]|uniref:hypothetical protein n=1 Tax=Microbacterium enclense TaxID=993073 RepID=UPI003F80EF1B
MHIGTPVTLPDGSLGQIVGRDGHPFEQFQVGNNPNVRARYVLLESGEIRLFADDSLAMFGSSEDIRQSGTLK